MHNNATITLGISALLICTFVHTVRSESESEPGFVSLFDGKTLHGWQGATEHWAAEEGSLVFVRRGAARSKQELLGLKLMSTKEYANFILRFECKLPPGSNNGVAIRAPLEGDPAFAGMEIQIQDTHYYRKLKDYEVFGSVYGVAPAKTGYLKPNGQWNTEEITCVGNHIRVKLNGVEIVDVDLHSIGEETLDQKSHPGLKRTKGHIGFLGHTGRVAFRNIRIKDLGVANPHTDRPHVRVRGIYGGMPLELIEQGKTLQDYGVNAIFMGSGGLTAERLTLLKQQGARVFAEFNTMHVAGYLKDHPEAAPVGVDGKVCPAPQGWQGICPTHPDYRKFRMDDFRKVLVDFEVDGIWLDYHHSHASWERAVPEMPDTCFCQRCIARFARETQTALPDAPAAQLANLLLGKYKDRWIQWRCDVFTDWVREFRSIVDQTRPEALLGTFHCPWTDTDFDGAMRNKLAIDLKAQAEYVDVFSIMPYHARFGHAEDPAWISRQTAWLGSYLGIRGEPDARRKIWPIVQLSDWGETVPVDQVRSVLDHGTRLPATGVMVFNWGSLRSQMAKVDQMGDYYRTISRGSR